MTDFSAEIAQVRQLVATDPRSSFNRLQALGGRLDRSEHIMAAAGILKVLATSPLGVPRRRLAVAGECAVDSVAAAAAVMLAAEGILAEVYVAPFGTLAAQILDSTSDFHTFKPELVLLVPDPEGAREDAASFWAGLWKILADRHSGVRIMQHLYEEPENNLTGVAESRVAWSSLALAREVNQALLGQAPGYVHFIDMERLSAKVGKLSFRDPRLWHHGKVPIALKHVPDYARALAGAVRRSLGRSRKALVVDLDNTLWGGVIGDDGLEGIRLGPGDAVGEAHAAFCTYIKELSARGVILAISSKNDAENALEVFESHPHMPLKSDDFATIRCNWEDKAGNLRAIAAELNIDLSAMVLADDNPAECELIRQELPQVAVVELSGDPSNFVRTIDRLRLFELDMILAEDLRRAAAYRARREAESLRAQATNLDEYFRSLNMRGAIWTAQPGDLVRLSQMEGKTNQFNLTTMRWSAEQLAGFMAAPDHDVLCFRLLDKFADHGLVSSLVVRYGKNEAEILSWLMSCRVFSRTAEEFIFAALIDRVRARGLTTLRARYIESAKNSIVAGLYPRLGFVGSAENFQMILDGASKPHSYISSISPAEMSNRSK